MSSHRRQPLVIVFATVVLLSSVCRSETNWPQWRGPTGRGHSDAKLPTQWQDSDVLWRVEVPGRGHSSPVLWGDRIFLTSSEPDGSKRFVHALDRKTGKVQWSQQVWQGAAERSHRMNMFASATCAVDGERVIAFFGHAGLHCLDLDGNRIWERKLGPFVNPWGTASSPVIHGDLVVQNCESEETSFLLGVDKQSGETAWRTRRESVRGWSTPILVGVAGKQELIINSELGVNGYDPFTGKDLWFSRGERGRGTPTVVEQDGVVVAVSGRPGAMWATKPGGRGDVNSTHEVWRTTRKAGRDLGSPIIVGEYLFVVSYRPGVASVYDLKTGNELAKSRLAGNVSASPIAAGGHLYVPNESGVVFVIKADQSLEVVAKNQIAAEEDELFRASIAAADGRMYVRSDHALYCIEK